MNFIVGVILGVIGLLLISYAVPFDMNLWQTVALAVGIRLVANTSLSD